MENELNTSSSILEMFGGDENKKWMKIVGITVAIIFVVIIIIVFLYLILSNNSGIAGNRLTAGSSGCCRSNQLFRFQDVELGASDVDVDLDNMSRYPNQRLNSSLSYGFVNHPFSVGSGFDNVLNFQSKPNALPETQFGLNPNNKTPIVSQKLNEPQYLRPYLGEEAIVNFAYQP